MTKIKPTSIHMPPTVKAQAAEAAKKTNRSKNNFYVHAIIEETKRVEGDKNVNKV